MAGQRTLKGQRAIINGFPVLAELEEHTPINVKKVMEETRGGSFMPSEIMVGLEKMTSSLKIIGATAGMLQSYGLKPGDVCQIDVLRSEQDADSNVFSIVSSMSGEITSIEEEALKMGTKPSVSISGTFFAYKKTENGSVIYDINTKTGVINLGQGDLMVEHRRNIGLS